jgi:hypothetical protein
MAKYLTDSTDIEIEEVSGTENLKFNLADGNSVEQMIGDLSNLSTTNKSNIVNALNEVNTNLNNLNTYSATETLIGEWLGEPLYRKVISCGSLPNASQKTVAHNISNLKKVINAYGMSERPSPLTWLPVNSNRPELSSDGVGMFVDNVNVNLFAGIDRTAFTETYVVVEYTKN